MKNFKEILLFLFLINFIKSYESFSMSDEKTESKTFMHNYYVKLFINNTFIKLKPIFNTHYVLINSSFYDFFNSSTYRKLNNEKKEINISNNLFYGYESTELFKIPHSITYSNYTNFPFLLVTENKINDNENYYPSFMGLAPGENPKMNFMKYLESQKTTKFDSKCFQFSPFVLSIGRSYDYENIISLKPLNINSLEYEFYKIDFGNFFHSIQLPNKVTFTVDTDYTILPYKYFNQVKKLIEEKYFNTDFCYEEIDNKKKYYHYIRCNNKYFESYNMKNSKKRLRFFPLSSYPHLYIDIKEEFIYDNLYNHTANYLKIIFDDRENAFDGWILGNDFNSEKFDYETGNLIYNYKILSNEINDLFGIIFVSVCIIITIIIVLICYKCDRKCKYKILKYSEISLIFLYAFYFIVFCRFTCKEGLRGLFDLPFTFLILLPGFISIFLKICSHIEKKDINDLSISKIIKTRIIYLVLYLGSIFFIQLYADDEITFFANVYTWSLVIYFILDNGFDIYVALNLNKNNETFLKTIF